jgi:hypothetical protein
MSVMGYISTSELVSAAKSNLGIHGDNDQLSDDEIRSVVKLIGVWSNAPVNLQCMLIVTAVEFPAFFSRYGLFVED